MRLKTITKELFTLQELKDRGHDSITSSAYDRAISKLADWALSLDWYESVYDDAETIGAKISGFDIDRGSYCELKLIESVADVCAAILANHGEQCDTYTLAEQTKKEIDNLLAFAVLNDWFAVFCARAMVDPDESSFDWALFEYDGWSIDIANDYISDEIEPYFTQQLSEEYLSMLRKEYEYLTSEEQLLDMAEANNYEFDCNGDIA